MVSEKADPKNCWLFQIYENKKKWVILHFWHPLKIRWTFFISFPIISILIAFLIDNYIINRKPDFAFTWSIGAAVIIAIIIFYFTQKEIKRLEYADALKKLLIEFGENKDCFERFTQIVNERFDELEKENKWNWMPKQDSYTNWANGNNFQYKYFSTNAYFNFVNQGHILNTKYLEIPKGQIANIYEIYFDFNIKLQHTENLIQNFSFPDYYYLEIPHDTKKFYYRLLKYEIPLKMNLKNIDCGEFGNILWDITTRDVCPFDNEKEIIKFLKCQFYNHYANDHINSGFFKNYQAVHDQLAQYFDFENEEIRKKEKEKKSFF
ncbi:hypothetical protein F1737_10410 [Methanoplanus sp. FWC-SCC4]|uniref:DUF3137 domain-containing protein n=2 Tax=Methanochimaera problematica TaxID=2609417 RepID=A0AA97FCU5_9EURY|nr:hypothetical protein F1737_10410 [Methanoplanus sp. FWC-SCC4]